MKTSMNTKNSKKENTLTLVLGDPKAIAPTDFDLLNEIMFNTILDWLDNVVQYDDDDEEMRGFINTDMDKHRNRMVDNMTDKLGKEVLSTYFSEHQTADSKVHLIQRADYIYISYEGEEKQLFNWHHWLGDDLYAEYDAAKAFWDDDEVCVQWPGCYDILAI